MIKGLRFIPCLLLLVTGCPDEEPPPEPPVVDAGTESPLDTYDCDPVTETLESLPRCSADEQCPCGAHCALGQCAVDCQSDGDCADGSRCDAFGRCLEPEAHPEPVQSPSAERRGRLVVRPERIDFADVEREHTVRVSAMGHSIDEVQVLAPEGLLVRCGEAGDFVERCRLQSIRPEAEQNVHVRVSPERPLVDEERYWSLRFVQEGESRTVQLRQAAPLVDPEPREGRYEGRLRLVGVGRADPAESLELPVYGNLLDAARGFHLVLVDPGGVIARPDQNGEARLLVRMEEGDDGLTLEVASQPYFARERAEGGLNPAYSVLGASSSAAWVGSGLQADLVLSIGDGAESHRLRWRLQLNRIRDLNPDQADEFTRPEELRPDAVAEENAALVEDQRALVSVVGGAIDRPRGSERSLMRCLYPDDTIACGVEPCSQEAVDRFNCTREIERNCPPVGPCLSFHVCRLNDVQDDPSLDADWRHSTCVQRYLCADDTALDSMELNTRGAPAFDSGDFQCADGSAPQAIPLFAALDREAAQQDARNELLSSCLADLDAGIGDNFEEAFVRRSCFSRARFVMALHHATAPLLDETRSPEMDAERRRSGALLLHLLGRWVDLHSFLARQTVQAAVLSEAVDRRERPPALDRVADRLRRALDLLLDPRLSRALAHLPDSVVADPDYRRVLGDREIAPDNGARTDHSRGLPIRVLELLASKAELEAKLLRRSHRTHSLLQQRMTVQAVARGLSRSLLLEARAHRFADRADAGASEAFVQARTNLRAARRQLVARAEALRANRNPLGIEDIDLHTVFPADQARSCREAGCYFGFSDDLKEKAAAAVRTAEAQVEAARAAYAQEMSRTLQSRDRGEQNAEIARRYGGAILRMCGPCSGQPTEESLVIAELGDLDADEFAATCFMKRRAEASCTDTPLDEDPVRGAVVADMGYELCVRGQMRRLMGPALSHGDVAADALVDRFVALRSEAEERSLDALRSRAELEGEAGLALLRRVLRGSLRHASPEAVETVADARRQASTLCGARWPGHRGGVKPPLAEVDPNADDEPFQGELGQLAIGVLVAAKAVETQRQRLVDLSERYDLTVQGCRMGLAADEDAAAFEVGHHDRMRKLRRMQMAVSAGTALVRGLVESPVSGVAALVSAGLGEHMQGMEEAHETAVRARAANARFRRCMHEAKQHLIGVRVAQLAIDRAALEARQRHIQLNEAKGTVARLLREGRLARQRFQDRETERLDQDLWLTERIDRFDRAMERARRYVYLLVRTQEYEQQMTLPDRSEVISASTPEDLAEIVTRLADAGASRRVDGGLPGGPYTLVLSLRDDILGLRDRAEEADRPGGHRMTAIEAFRRRMASAEAERDAQGNVVAFRIPFVLHPRGGDEPGILPADGCGERIMGMTLNLVGRDLRDGLSLEPIQVGKANTFHSQWCSDEARQDGRFQVQSHRPHRNLVAGEERPERPGRVLDWQQVQPVENQSVSAFRDHRAGERETAHGFAGRGLFGGYALRFPVGTAWRLNRLEDVLLRIDYVSVAR